MTIKPPSVCERTKTHRNNHRPSAGHRQFSHYEFRGNWDLKVFKRQGYSNPDRSEKRLYLELFQNCITFDNALPSCFTLMCTHLLKRLSNLNAIMKVTCWLHEHVVFCLQRPATLIPYFTYTLHCQTSRLTSHGLVLVIHYLTFWQQRWTWTIARFQNGQYT